MQARRRQHIVRADPDRFHFERGGVRQLDPVASREGLRLRQTAPFLNISDLRFVPSLC